MADRKKLSGGELAAIGVGAWALMSWKSQQDNLQNNPAYQNAVAAGATNPSATVTGSLLQNFEITGAAAIDELDMGSTHLAADVYQQQVGLAPAYADQLGALEGDGGSGILAQADAVTAAELQGDPGAVGLAGVQALGGAAGSLAGAAWNGINGGLQPTTGLSLGMILAGIVGVLLLIGYDESHAKEAA